MNISFDLDSTLIPSNNEFETEKVNKFALFLGVEKIRKGTPILIEKLSRNGHEVSIYTTSYRSKLKISLTLKYYGIKVNRTVNQSENQRVLRAHNINASKYPPVFGFDLHIDDSLGVEIEGKKYNFKTIIVNPVQDNWIEIILDRIDSQY